MLPFLTYPSTEAVTPWQSRLQGVLLETDRLLLRRFTPDDLEHLVELDNDPAVMRFLTGGTTTPRDIIERDILPRFLHYDEQSPSLGFWAAIERSSRAFVGWFSLRPTHDGSVAEVALGYRLRRAAWGRGLATEGARALIAKCFETSSVERIVATTYEENLASRRVLEKLGMTLVRRFRMSLEELRAIDTVHDAAQELWDGDDVEYLLVRAEWRKMETR